MDIKRVDINIKNKKTRINNFKDNVYDQMTKSLEICPKMNPPRIEKFVHNDPYYALIIMGFNILYSSKKINILTMTMCISGYLSHIYSTNNTNMMYYSILGYGILLIYFF